MGDTRVTVGGKKVASSTKFKCLGSIMQNDGEIDKDVSHRVQTGGLNGEQLLGCCVIRNFA